ncbi:MAG: hypothetical protein JWL97_3692 [Gemmatimonadales bacterium]|nr:hypothetical protein [Gemmatimonadales bacterium]
MSWAWLVGWFCCGVECLAESGGVVGWVVERSVMGEELLGEIGGELRRLRFAAGLSGVELARRAGVPQATVSRVETGRRVADAGVVMRLFDALRLEPAEADRLVSLVREVYGATVARRVDAGVSFRPGAAVEWVRRARVVRSFSSAVIPALLRTPDYAGSAEPLSPGGEAEQAAVLGEAGRRFVFVVGEAALRTWPGSGACMAGQLAHLLEVAGRPNVRLGVVPGSVPSGSARSWVPLHGFTLYDEAAVTVETFTRELTLSDEHDVRVYIEAFGGFEEAAVFGDEARVLVERAADDLGNVLGSIH